RLAEYYAAQKFSTDDQRQQDARPKCTAIMAFVRGVIAASTRSGSMQSVSGSTSTMTGMAPANRTALAVATKVESGTITSSPGPIFSATITTSNAAVPLVTAIPCFAP